MNADPGRLEMAGTATLDELAAVLVVLACVRKPTSQTLYDAWRAQRLRSLQRSTRSLRRSTNVSSRAVS